MEFELLGTTKALHAPVAFIVYKPLPGDIRMHMEVPDNVSSKMDSYG